MSKPEVEVAITEYPKHGFYTVSIVLSTGEAMPLGKHWKREVTANKWAEKIKKYHEEKGYKTTITRRTSTW